MVETRQAFTVVTKTEENAKSKLNSDECGAQGGSLNAPVKSLNSCRDNGCRQRLWDHVECCMGWRGASTGPSRSAGGQDGKRTAASALSAACDALSERSKVRSWHLLFVTHVSSCKSIRNRQVVTL